MKYIIFVMIILFTIPSIIVSVLKRFTVISAYDAINKAYESMMKARQLYYKANFIEDEQKRTELQTSLKNVYDTCISILDDKNIAEQVSKMPEAMREECLEMINSPRYGLF